MTSASTTLSFTGATGTVTGSHHLLETGGRRILLDCGLYQGEKAWRQRNWEPFVVPPNSIDAVVLSHAHIDHTGYLPRLVRDGFRGPVYATAATRDLCEIMLPDSARLMEEEAEYRNRKGATRFQPALPLYTEQEAERAAAAIQSVPLGDTQRLPGGASVTFHRAGHILGSAMLDVAADGRRLLFTGDIGRTRPALLAPRASMQAADFLLIESTYGNRRHEESDPRPAIEAAVNRITGTGGVLVIPSFAVGRSQEVLFLIRDLEDLGRIAALPVYVDSPMATDVTELYRQYDQELSDAAKQAGDRAIRPRRLDFTRSVEQSKALNARNGPLIIISSSGMATGGRVLHHLRQRLPDAANGVLLVGHQGEGTRGRQLADGAQTINIFRQQVPVRAQVTTVDALSAHADAAEMIAWMRGFMEPPRRVFLVHGEDDARAEFAERIRRELGWNAHVPEYLEEVPLA